MNPETISPAQPVAVGAAETVPGKARTSLFGRALVAIAILFVVVRALPILTLPLGNDQGAYLMIGQGLLEGKQLYRDLMDTKPPGIFVVYAGIAKLFGRVMWSAAAADTLLLLVISYFLFRFSERYVGRAGAAIAVMVHASMHGEMRYYWIAQPETFQVACVLAGYVLMLRRRRWSRVSCFAAGLALGYGCWLKYNAIAFLPFLLFLPYLDTSGLDRQPPRVSLVISWRSWLAKAALLLAGLAAAIAIVLAWIVLKGAWPAMKEAQFEVVPRYAAMAVQRRPHYLLSALMRTYYCVGGWNLCAVLAALLVGRLRRDLRRFAPLFLAALTSYAAVVMQLRFHDYYFQTCYPFFAVLWAYLAVSLYEGSRALARHFRQRGWRLATGLVWIAFAQAVFWPLPEEFNRLTMRYEHLREWRTNQQTFYADYPDQLPFEYMRAELEVIDFLKQNARPYDGLYVWGTRGVIYYLTGHIPPTRFHANLGIMSAWCPPLWREELVRDLRNTQPRFIVVARRDAIPSLTYANLDSEKFLKTLPQLETFVTSNYTPLADFDTFVIYRRN
jgi:hypothetical protein